MPHDDSNKCKEEGVKVQQHVMAPTLNYNTNPWMWSKCSRKYITEFLEYVISTLLFLCVSAVNLKLLEVEQLDMKQEVVSSC